ncbi:MAG: response regulator transcription factor [Anaerolineales bacterium]|jgi:DNA-binding NarL/FixJ family response regulator|nr:response regulator transcription factor [Anaerolineales bacterium]
MTIRILIADDHGLIRAGLRALLQSAANVEVVGEAEDGISVLSRVAELKPDIVLMDVSMPGMSGIDATQKVREISPGTRVLALTVHEDEGMLRKMIRAGAHGYIIKRAVESDLLQAIKVVSQGYIYVHPSLTGALVQDLSPHQRASEAPQAVLTAREMDVLRLLARGYTNRQIAKELNLSARTIEGYRANLVSKLGMKSRVELMNYVEQHDLTGKNSNR